ncbi:protein shisa-4-like isoform X2 [Hyperolius riggenbachi]|uniref:protein shisa-4-like isoform X2 n=1 Tax=Hyperolius riggenbachi TaxID=752182 RepID=UPI0035A31428
MDRPAMIPVLIAALCLAGVVADDCSPYVDSDFAPHRGQMCVLSFCAGTCTNRYCSIIPGTDLDQSQFMCIVTNLYVVIGAAIVLALITIAGVITCICKSLCLCCSLCTPTPRPARVTTSVAVTNVVPQQPMLSMPGGTRYQPLQQHPGYYEPGKAYLPPPYPGADNVTFVDSP